MARGDSFEEFEASSLFCPRCRRATPARKKLLLVLPSGNKYDYVCAETARGLMRVQLDTGVPCAFGVLTCDTMEQALARAGGAKRDQGRHAAEVVLRMAAVRAELGG